MKLSCPKSIITDNLLIYIDLTNPLSWNPNISGYTLTSLYKWKNARVGNISLPDFGLTGFDNGRVNNMLSGLTLTTNDNKLKLYRVGYNVITNHTGTTSGNTFITGVTARISYSG